MTSRQHPRDRATDLLHHAVAVAAEHGWENLTREAVAQRAGVSPALVSARLGTMENLRRSVMRAAVRDGVVPVVAQGIARGDKRAMAAGPALRAAVVEWMGRSV